MSLVCAVLLLGAGAAAPNLAQADDVVVDAQSPGTAAASCWEIKQKFPEARSGVYWLVTPRLEEPSQYYCDMATDGGGWVLIGRGREDWSYGYGSLDGYRTSSGAAELHDVVDGPGAFAPRQLPAAAVDGLLNGARVDDLADGVRLRRATNSTGTKWQESRVRLAKRDRWTWAFGAELPVSTYQFDGVAGSGGITSSFGSNSQFRRVDTQAPAARNYVWGFAFGSQVTGSPSDSTYLWSATNNGGGAVPFTQVFVRPRLMTADLQWPSPSDAGLPAVSRSPLLASGAEPQTWGVSGLANGLSGELNVEVQAFAQVGTTVFVGGNFKVVQKGANAEGMDQPYLAAFDARSGEWIPTFRPRLNGQVLSLAALPSGQLVVGGEFTDVNGTPAAALVALRPDTGERDTAWNVALENRISGGVLRVRAMDVQDGWLYLGGSFTHLSGGARTNPVYARHAARIDWSTATPDVWNPAFDGTVVDIDASSAGDRVYAAGYFTQTNGEPANKVVALSTDASAALVPGWSPSFSTTSRSNYQQAVAETAGRVWVGGSEHSLFSYDRSSFARLSGNITKQGGDFQAVTPVSGTVYAGCHCNEWNYSEAYTWSSVGTAWTQADKIGFIGAWDASTGAFRPDFSPTLRARSGHGAWAIFEDSTGQVWVGGDFTSAVKANGAVQWVGGFVRFSPRDTVPPTTPSGLTSAATAQGTTVLSWSGATDDRPGMYYQVLRNGRVIAMTTERQVTVPSPLSAPERYFVRAVDSAGNKSATTPVRTVVPGAPIPAEPVEVVPMGSQWAWVFDGVERGTEWRDLQYGDSSWNVGPARIGFNIGGEATLIPTSGTGAKPVTAYYRTTFALDGDPSRFSKLHVDLVRDDGAIVYVNGVEVLRDNMPTGPVTVTTGASATVSTTWAARTPVSFDVPSSALRSGTNVVAVEVHQNHAWGNDMSFDLRLVATS